MLIHTVVQNVACSVYLQFATLAVMSAQIVVYKTV